MFAGWIPQEGCSAGVGQRAHWDETCHVGILDGLDIVYIARVGQHTRGLSANSPGSPSAGACNRHRNGRTGLVSARVDPDNLLGPVGVLHRGHPSDRRSTHRPTEQTQKRGYPVNFPERQPDACGTAPILDRAIASMASRDRPTVTTKTYCVRRVSTFGASPMKYHRSWANARPPTGTLSAPLQNWSIECVGSNSNRRSAPRPRPRPASGK